MFAASLFQDAENFNRVYPHFSEALPGKYRDCAPKPQILYPKLFIIRRLPAILQSMILKYWARCNLKYKIFVWSFFDIKITYDICMLSEVMHVNFLLHNKFIHSFHL